MINPPPPNGLGSGAEKPLLILLQSIGRNIRKGWDWFIAPGPGGRLRRVLLIILLVVITWFGLTVVLAPINRAMIKLVDTTVDGLSEFQERFFGAPAPTPTPGLVEAPAPTPVPQPIPVPLIERLPRELDAQLQRAYEPDTLRHLLVVLLGSWLGYQISALFLSEAFELNDFRLAQRYLRGFLFGTAIRRYQIENGVIIPASGSPLRHVDRPPYMYPDDRTWVTWEDRSILRQLGSSGEISIAPENLIVVEDVNGMARVIGPTSNRSVLIDTFTRLHQIIDLRDQRVILSITGFTRQGIQISAVGASWMFSVYRNQPNPALVPAPPYPYDPQAILNLVYRYWKGDFYSSVVSMIQADMQAFIGSRSVEMFLPFLQLEQSISPDIAKQENPFKEFEREFNQQSRIRGVQLFWEGMGEWTLTPVINLHTQPKAWQLMLENRRLRAELMQENQTELLLSQIHQVPIGIFEQCQSRVDSRERTCLALLRAYCGTLTKGMQELEKIQQTPPSELLPVRDHFCNLAQSDGGAQHVE